MLTLKHKLIASCALVGSLLAMPVLANAQTLIISNATDHSFALTVNGACTSELGLVNEHSIVTIPDAKLQTLCSSNSKSCEIVAHNDTCSGVSAGTLTIKPDEVGVKGSDQCMTVGATVSDAEIDWFFTQYPNSYCQQNRK